MPSRFLTKNNDRVVSFSVNVKKSVFSFCFKVLVCAFFVHMQSGRIGIPEKNQIGDSFNQKYGMLTFKNQKTQVNSEKQKKEALSHSPVFFSQILYLTTYTFLTQLDKCRKFCRSLKCI